MRHMGRGIRGALAGKMLALAAVIAVTATGLARAAEAAWPVRVDTVSYDQTTIKVLDQGTGPVVVMIPSLGRGAADFDDLAARVAAAGYRVLRPQPRGIGGSTGPQGGITLRSLAEDIAHAVPLTLLAGIGHWMMGSVDWQLLVSLLTGSIPGIIFGSLIAARVPDGVLRPILASTLVLVGGKLLT